VDEQPAYGNVAASYQYPEIGSKTDFVP